MSYWATLIQVPFDLRRFCKQIVNKNLLITCNLKKNIKHLFQDYIFQILKSEEILLMHLVENNGKEVGKK